jgi:uncharacterized membrane protein
MTLLISGLALFLGAHSLRIVADGLRTSVIAKLGPGPWKGLFTLASLAGLALIVVGYGQSRDGTPFFIGGAAARHAAYALVWLGFIGVTAAYWPRNHIKQIVGDPMVAGVGLWALGHLLVKTTPAALALFGAFLVWALIDYVSLRARAAAAPPAPNKASVLQTLLALVAGSALWAVFALFLHKWMIGVSPIA